MTGGLFEGTVLGSDDDAIFRAAQDGDREARAHLVERHMRPVYAFAFRMTGNHADADDIVQQAFLKGFEALGRCRPGTNFRAWILTIAARLCTDLHRRKKTRREVPYPESAEGPSLPGSGDAAEALAEAEDGRAVWNALEALPPEQRALVLLHGLEGVPMSLIARESGVPEGTVRWRFHQARTRLKALLESREPFGITAGVSGGDDHGRS